jgi:hypothetical protein
MHLDFHSTSLDSGRLHFAVDSKVEFDVTVIISLESSRVEEDLATAQVFELL